jgi:NAD(P)-dependent dehydrogenase (short-subunit alcohol dehydrogenase family)
MFGISLQGRTAIVTGAGRGIGRAIAVALARAGADVALASRTPAELEEVASEIRAGGRRALVAPTDVTDRLAVEALVDRTIAELGRLDVMVNNAGIAPFTTPFLDTSPEDFDACFRANVDAVVHGARAAGRVLLAQGSGCVLNLASIDAFMAEVGLAYYNAAKAAVVSLTRTLALEWAAGGVRVNAIAPGWIDTPMNAPEKADPQAEARILAQIPMGRWGRPEEIAAAAVFLCSDAASFITGEVLVVDGGQTVTSARER